VFYLFSQVWVLILIAFLLGLAAGYLFWARPIARAADQLDKR